MIGGDEVARDGHHTPTASDVPLLRGGDWQI